MSLLMYLFLSIKICPPSPKAPDSGEKSIIRSEKCFIFKCNDGYDLKGRFLIECIMGN